MGDYGETIDIASPFFAATSNDQVILSQAILMRLSTKRGTYWDDPEYGICVSDFLQSELTQDALVRIPFEIQAQLEADERITSAQVTAQVAQVASGVRLLVTIVVTASTGATFPLTLSVSALTVELLTRGTA